ncbi:sensor histidine kinase [Chondromyces apiculatus]|uniref:histidine kinase n=1 Tax=Chondromyces apiculatus DSM 436 TaxID=1192034 RepID=A0A017TD21_9BACT|nr:sensor histidine kinase [Chondromyces apiculatus]EYF06715.1 PAS:ATP-binding region, ATPase-like protein:Histidine kinase A-like protein [Chondromyces apiculatus DSM 436]
MSEERRARRTVAGRLLASFLIVLAAFALTVGWSVQALRAGSRDAELLRSGYAPLLVRVGEVLAEQNVFNAQLNHITAARNPGDVREWIETARRTRPIAFSLVRETAERLTDPGAPFLQPLPARMTRQLGAEIASEAAAIERLLAADPERFAQLFQALAVGDHEAAERARDELIKREAEGAQRLRAIKSRLEERMASLSATAKSREERSMQLLLGLGALTLLVGIGTSLHARRVLAPLTAMTARAKAVARGDLSPQNVVATADEIGELATTFEGMVAAIRRARADLVQAERLTTIGKMAAHITHEIRNPLSSIGLNLELLEEEIARMQEGRESSQLLSAIRAEVDRLSRIAEQYLSVARRPRPQLEPERLQDLVEEFTAFVLPELQRSQITLRVEADASAPEVRVDEAQLRQALLNLVRNAREAMSNGGTIVIAIHQRDDSAEITIDDTGPGIPEELRASVFDPFFTTKQRGTGLGLAVTRDIIASHGGTITCEARETGGTRFRITLPLNGQALSA